MGSVTSLAGLTEQAKPKIFSPPGVTHLLQGNGALYVHKLYPTLPNLDGQRGQSVWVGTRTCSHCMCQSILHLCSQPDQIACQFHTMWGQLSPQMDGFVAKQNLADISREKNAISCLLHFPTSLSSHPCLGQDENCILV